MAIEENFEGFTRPSAPKGPWLYVLFSEFNQEQNLWAWSEGYVCSTLWLMDGMYHLQLPYGSLIHLSMEKYSLYRVINCSQRWAKRHFPELFPSGEVIIV